MNQSWFSKVDLSQVILSEENLLHFDEPIFDENESLKKIYIEKIDQLQEQITLYKQFLNSQDRSRQSQNKGTQTIMLNIRQTNNNDEVLSKQKSNVVQPQKKKIESKVKKLIQDENKYLQIQKDNKVQEAKRNILQTIVQEQQIMIHNLSTRLEDLETEIKILNLQFDHYIQEKNKQSIIINQLDDIIKKFNDQQQKNNELIDLNKLLELNENEFEETTAHKSFKHEISQTCNQQEEYLEFHLQKNFYDISKNDELTQEMNDNPNLVKDLCKQLIDQNIDCAQNSFFFWNSNESLQNFIQYHKNLFDLLDQSNDHITQNEILEYLIDHLKSLMNSNSSIQVQMIPLLIKLARLQQSQNLIKLII